MFMKLRQLPPAEITRFLKYGVIGTLGAIIDLGTLNLLIFVVGLSTDAGKLAANIISTSAAITSNYIWNRLWTFPEAQGQAKTFQFMRFVFVALAGLVFNTTIFYLTNRYIYAPLLSEGIAIQLAKMNAIGLVLFWNFGLNRFWTFRLKPEPDWGKLG
ncbi:MAG: GtrA family protein [Chloroflexota bacterium]